MKRLWIVAMAASLICVAPGCSKDDDPTPPPDEERKDHAEETDNSWIIKVGHAAYKIMGNSILHVNLLFDGKHEENQFTDTLTIPHILKIPMPFGKEKTYRVTAIDLSDGDARYNQPYIEYLGDVSYTCPTVMISEGIDSIINFYPTLCIWPRGGQPAKLKDLWLPKSLKYIGPNPFFEKYRDRNGKTYTNRGFYLLPSPYADGLRIHVPDLEAWCAVEVDDTYLPPRSDSALSGVGDIFPQYTLCIGNDTVSDLVIPAGVTGIGPRVFTGASIKSVRMHDGVKSIGNFAFSKCKYLESVELPAGLDEISPFVFRHCRSLHYINIPKGVKRVGEGAFYYSSLRTLELPVGLEAIGNKGFAATPLKELTIPGSVRTVEDSAFYSCLLKKLTLLSGKTEYGYGAFSCCDYLTEVSLPPDIEEISDAMFHKCTSLKRIGLPGSLKTIGKSAFEESGLEEVRIPEGVTTIGDDAFYYCKNLKTVFLPKSLKKIGTGAFWCGASLTDVYCFSETPPESDQAIFHDAGKGKNLYVPAGAEERYRADEQWRNFNIHGIDVTAAGQVRAAAADGGASFYDLSGRLIGKGRSAADARKLAAPGTVVIMAGNGGSRKIVVE